MDEILSHGSWFEMRPKGLSKKPLILYHDTHGELLEECMTWPVASLNNPKNTIPS